MNDAFLRQFVAPEFGDAYVRALPSATLHKVRDAGHWPWLDDETVSRFHCEIEVRNGRALVRDLGSRNGTAIDGVSVREAWLHGGATLSLAEAWRSSATSQPDASKPAAPRNASWLQMARPRAGQRTPMTHAPEGSHPLLLTVTVCVGVAIGVAVAVLAKDVIVGVIVAALLIAAATQITKLWSGHGKIRHP